MLKQLFNLLIVLYPIISGYGFSPNADFGVLLLFIIGCICIARYGFHHFKFVFPQGYLFFFISAIVCSIIFAHTVPLRLVLFSIVFAFAIYLFDFELFKRYYRVVVIICCAFFLLQELSFYVTGVRICGLSMSIPLIYGNNAEYIAGPNQTERSASFFLEVSYFTQFLIPFVIMKLFSGEKKDFRECVIVSLIIVIGRSGNGIILVMFIWSFWFLFGSFKSSVKIWGLVIAIIAFISIKHIRPELFESYMSRSSELQLYGADDIYFTSGFIRFFRGYYLYSDLPLMNQLFGTNPSDVESIMSYHSLFGASYSKDVFINGLQTLLIYNGLFVTLIYARHIFLFLNNCLHSKVIVLLTICFIYLMCSESYYLCSRSMVMILIIMAYRQIEIHKQLDLKTDKIYS